MMKLGRFSNQKSATANKEHITTDIPVRFPQSILTDEHTVGLYPIAYDQPIA
jgi:hypothetical protein